MKVITLLNTLRHEADYYTTRGDNAKTLLVKMTKKYLPRKLPYAQGCGVVVGTGGQLVINVPYKLPEGWLYMVALINTEVVLDNHYVYKISVQWANSQGSCEFNNTPFDPRDLAHIWVDVVRDMTAALYKDVSGKDKAYEVHIT